MIYLADGSVRLRVRHARPSVREVEAEVEIGGAVASRQGLNIPGPVDALPAVPEEDLALLRHGESIGVDMVALSFVRRPEDIELVRDHTRLPLIAKMEKPQAVRTCRGDPACGGLRDGRARGTRYRAADRARADCAEGAPAPRRLAGAALDHGDADARLDGRPPRARRAPRSRTSRTRSSMAPTR